MRSVFSGRAVLALATILVLAACATGSPSRSSSGSPTVRCIDEPGRGQSPESTRPLFFLFCAQTP